MAVKIRLTRMGAKKKPFYRVVAADIRMPRDGRFLDILGTYDPHADPAAINLDEDKIISWLGKGAIPTDTAKQLIKKCGIYARLSGATTADAPVPEAPKAPEAVQTEAQPSE